MYNQENLSLFPTLVSAFDLNGHIEIEKCLEIINKYETGDHALILKGKSSFINGDEEFLFNPELKKLRADIQNCIDLYCRDAGLEESILGTSWFNVLGKDGQVDKHRHEGSVVSGAFYPYVDEDSCPLIFESPLRPLRMNDVFENQNPYSSYFASCKPRSGLLLIFPSWLEHRTDPNPSEKRITVSFNTMRKKLIPLVAAKMHHYGHLPVDKE